MGSIDATLKAMDEKLDTTAKGVRQNQQEQAARIDVVEGRVSHLETWKTASNARTGAIAGGTALAAPPFIKWVLDFSEVEWLILETPTE